MTLAERRLIGRRWTLLAILMSGFIALQMIGAPNPSYSVTMATGIPIATNAYAIAINQNTDRVYATASNSVFVIDAMTDKGISNFTLGVYPQTVIVNAVTNTLYVAHKVHIDKPGYSAESRVSAIDGLTNSVLASFNMNSVVDVDQSRNIVYMTNDSSTIYAISGQTNQVESSFILEHPSIVRTDSVHQRLYAASYSVNDTVSVSILDSISYQPVSEAISTGAPVGSVPMGLAVNSLTNRIYVGIQNRSDSSDDGSGVAAPSGFIAVIDGNTNKRISSISVPCFGDVQVNSVTNRIYATNALSGVLYIIDGNTNKLIDTVSGLYFPTAIAVSPKYNKIFVINHSSDFISVIHDSNLSSKPVSFSLSSELDGTTYRINGLAKNATVQSFEIFPRTEIALALDPQPHNGTIELVLPKAMIDGITGIHPASSDSVTSLEYKILNSNSTHTTVNFDVPKLTSKIEIEAATVVPELLGATLMVAISASIALTILLSRIRARRWNS